MSKKKYHHRVVFEIFTKEGFKSRNIYQKRHTKFSEDDIPMLFNKRLGQENEKTPPTYLYRIANDGIHIALFYDGAKPQANNYKPMKHTYHVTGMTCQSCAEKIQKALSEIEGIEKAEVNFEHKEATVTMSHHIELETLNEALAPLKKYKLVMPAKKAAPTQSHLPEKNLKTYWPLILVVLYIAFGTYYLSWLKADSGWMSWMPDFMGLFFLAFGFFKLLDLKGFAESYWSYDLPTKAWPTWGYIYPFVEVGLGLSYLFGGSPIWTNALTLVVMSVSIVGVIQSVLQKRSIKCACLGAGFNLPMGTITIIEDALMIGMAGYMLWLNLI